MPEITCLQIRGDDDRPARVVELTDAAVRVGRGVQCEVRLDQPELAEVQCLLRRRGETWHLQPVGPAGLVSIGGVPVDHSRPLPAGIGFEVGGFRLVIRPTQWGSFSAPVEVEARPPGVRVVDPTTAAGTEAEVERLRRWQARLEQREKWLQDRQGEKRWEARWRAAGEGLRSRGVGPGTQGAAPRSLPAPSRPAASPPPGEVARTTTSADVGPTTDVPSTSIMRISGAPAATGPGAVAATVEHFPSPQVVDPTPERASEPDEVSTTAEAGPPGPDPASIRSGLAEARPSGGSRHAAAASDLRAVESGNLAPDLYLGRSTGAIPGMDLPSAAAIFAAQGTRGTPPGPTSRKARRRPSPTDPREPSAWALPTWLACPPAGAVALVLAGLGLVLGVSWTMEARGVATAARVALQPATGPQIPLDPAAHPEARWWKTSARHQALWAAAIERSADAGDRADEAVDLLDSAVRAAPLEPVTRLALARAGTPDRAVALSRDVVALTLTARSLCGAGRVDPALRCYGRAIEMAVEADLDRLDPPTFDDDPQVRRHRLPHEAGAAGVVRDMVDSGLEFARWSSALPPVGVARLAAGRLLRERGSPDAERALELALAAEVVPPSSPEAEAEHHAARAEALALLGRTAEAAEPYRLAVGLTADAGSRRRWSLALAEILGRLGASAERDERLEAAKGRAPDDEITRRAVEAQGPAGPR